MWTNHKIPLDELQLICKAFLRRVSCCSLDLIVIIVQAGDMCTCEFGNLSRWASNSTANIEDFVAIFNADFRRKVVLVAGNGLVERFTVCESTEVEGLAPSVLVEICSEIVVTVTRVRGGYKRRHAGHLLSCESGVLCFPCL